MFKLFGQSSQDIQLGLWGTSGSGKSIYLGKLYMELLRSKQWEVRADPNAEIFLNRIVGQLQAGIHPDATSPQGKHDIYEYRLKGIAPPFQGVNVVLKFVDAPGKFYEDPSQGKGKIQGMDILDYLGSCDGIVYLLDPQRPDHEKTMGALLLPLMQEFHKRACKSSQEPVKRLQQYMAFCITKVDIESLWTRREPAVSLVQELMGEFLFECLENNFCQAQRLKFFSISSIGRYKDQEGNWHSVLRGKEPETPPPNSSSSQTRSSFDDIFGSPSPPPPPRDNRDAYGFSANAANPESTPKSARKIGSFFDASKNPQPFQVLTPIEWLIQSIRQNPPNLPNRKPLTPPKSDKPS